MQRTVTGLLLALGLISGSVASAGAQVYGYSAPPGSYLQTCVNAQVRGSTLTAACTDANGRRVWSSIDLSGCNGDIANANGRLICNGYNNGGYNNGGYNNGGYTRGGDDDDDNGGDREGNGRHRHHHPNGNAYGYYNHGPGSYNNGGYNGGYNNGGSNNGGYGYGLPPGSYQQSCTNARMSGSSLYASCSAPNGGWIGSSIDVRRCQSRNSDIANRNGYLSC